jgi:hypothetical protein
MSRRELATSVAFSVLQHLPLPAEPDPDLMPIRFGSREQLAALHERYFVPLSPRTLERWPLRWQRVNGRAVCDVGSFLAEAKRRFAEAPVMSGGERQSELGAQEAA